MKNHTPEKLIQGRCFVCLKPTESPIAYAHQECAYSMSLAREIENQKAKVLNLLEIIKEKDKMLKEKSQ